MSDCKRGCKHGNLTHSCYCCDLESRNAALEKKVEKLREALEKLKVWTFEEGDYLTWDEAHELIKVTLSDGSEK